MTRILIADDDHGVRLGLRTILENQPGFEVVGEAENGQEAVEVAIETKPDVVIMDYGMPLQNGAEATRAIKAKCPRTEVLMFTMHDSEGVVQDILAAGARGYLVKTDPNGHLIAAVEALERREEPRDPNEAHRLTEHL